MQVMERMGVFDPAGLDMASPVYTTRAAFETGLLGADLVPETGGSASADNAAATCQGACSSDS